MPNMIQTPATAALGCGGSLILLGSFISGFYLGQAQATGQTLDSNVVLSLKYSPTIVGGIFSSIATSAQLSVPGNLESMVSHVPEERRAQMSGCATGCSPIIGGIFGAALMGGVTYLGYAIGHSMGR